MKRIIYIAMIGILILSGCTGEAQKTEKEKEVKYVRTITAMPETFQEVVRVPGKAKAKEQVKVIAKVSGTVQTVSGLLGKEVKKGQVLATIEDTMYKVQYDNAVLGYKNAQDSVKRITEFSDVSMKSQDLQMAESALKNAQTQFDLIEKNYVNMKTLYEQGIVAKMDLDSIEVQYQTAKEGLSMANDSYKQAQRGYGFNVNAASSGVDMAKNALTLAKENLDNTIIKAPISGKISMAEIAVGDTINPGMSIFEIVNTSEMTAEIGISEKDIAKVIAGQKVKVTVSSLQDLIVEGTVKSVSPSANEMTKLYMAEIVIDNKENKIKPGMFLDLEIITNVKENSISIPKKIIQTEENGKYVYLYKDRTVKKVSIETGLSSKESIEVVVGIQQGEKVVSAGYEAIKDGDTVNLKEE